MLIRSAGYPAPRATSRNLRTGRRSGGTLLAMRIVRALLDRLRGTPPDPEQLRLAQKVWNDEETAKMSGRHEGNTGLRNPIDLDDFRPPR